MKIYKFKDLRDPTKHIHTFQIIDENKIWCASPASLNDPEEFRFEMDFHPTSRTETLLTGVIAKFGSGKFPPSMTASYAILNNKVEEFTKPLVSEMVDACRDTIGVTSFTEMFQVDALWYKYGGKGNGVAVEFELPESSLDTTYHQVEYVKKRMFHVDVFLESQLQGPRQIFRNILCTKTEKWQDENEIRYLAKKPDINIVFDIPITKVILGKIVSDDLFGCIHEQCRMRSIPVTRYEA